MSYPRDRVLLRRIGLKQRERDRTIRVNFEKIGVHNIGEICEILRSDLHTFKVTEREKETFI